MVAKTLKERFFTILLVVEILYLAIALMIPPLPGWKMFSSVTLARDVDFRDDQGNAVSLKAFMPAVFYEFDDATALKVAQFVCEKHPGVSKWSLRITKDSYELQTGSCLPVKK